MHGSVSKIIRFVSLGVALLAFCGAASISQGAAWRRGEVTRVILFWLKRPGNVDDRNILLRAAVAMSKARGVAAVRIGHAPHPLAGDPEAFDLGIIISFRDRGALERFESDARRKQMMEEALHSLVRRDVVYNLVSE